MRKFNLKSFADLVVPIGIVFVVGLPATAAGLDSRIETSARNSYNFKNFLKDDNIKVSSSAGVVTLTGTVSEDYHKSLAGETVSELPGVKGLNNKLTVAGEQPTEHSDGWISMKVKASLTFHKNVSATATGVNTQNGVVTLSGNASSEAQKKLTAEYAKDVEGVTEVRNDLVVTGKPAQQTLGEKVDDSSITAQIKTTLLFHKSTHAATTKVATKNGVVTLRGEAKNAAEKDLVTKLTEDIKGVRSVNNLMIVQKS